MSDNEQVMLVNGPFAGTLVKMDGRPFVRMAEKQTLRYPVDPNAAMIERRDRVYVPRLVQVRIMALVDESEPMPSPDEVLVMWADSQKPGAKHGMPRGMIFDKNGNFLEYME